ncbi:TrkA C-terminal domain-containing protein [Halobacteriaceae archaeon GCM10025711]
MALAGARELDSEVSPLVRAVGAVIPVTLPEDVADLDGYDPVASATKDHLAGTTLVFPRGLTVADLRERLVRRLKDDYDVGAVDVELDDDGRVTYLALGRRQAGLGHTLPPGTTALAVRADPAHAASAGDTVQVWTAGDDPGLVATAELRAAVDDVVTLVTDTVDAAAVDPDVAYRVVTLPATPRTDREFARLLRTADETMGVVSVPEESDLVGIPVGALDLTCIAVRPDDGPIDPIPSQSRVLAAGDTVYVVARPDVIRRLADAGVTTSL